MRALYREARDATSVSARACDTMASTGSRRRREAKGGLAMRCFYHHEAEAVAVCKNCGRGLCAGCAVEVGNGLACPNRCEADVRALNEVIARNRTAYQKTSGAYARIAAFYVLIGAVFGAAGLADWRGYGWLMIPAGVIFVAAGLVHYATGRRFERA
jgi:hypothetical protein